MAVRLLAAFLLSFIACAGQEEPERPARLQGVRSFDEPGAEHTEDRVVYDVIPPVGGDHHDIPQTCGFYDEPVRNEHAVHSLEHGAVWITFDERVEEGDVERLRELADDTPKVLVSPWDGDLPSPIVLSAWRRQLRLQSASDERLEAFVAEFVSGADAPEPEAACLGVGDPQE